MHLRQLFEAQIKTAVIGYGRMNPPTIGHAVLVNAINAKAKQYDGDPMLFLSMTQSPFLTPKGKTNKHFKTANIKNPLDWKTKLGYVNKFFDIPVSTDPSLNTIMSVMKYLENKGYEKVVLVCGSDRVKEFETQILPYNNTPDKSGNIAYNIKEVTVEQGGFRDEEATDASGMSASKMREAAAQDDFESFKQGVPDQSVAQRMFDDVRRGLGFEHQDESLDEYEVKQQKPKIEVLNNIAARKDGTAFPLSWNAGKGEIKVGGKMYVDPITANKFVNFFDTNKDKQDAMTQALRSATTTAKLFDVLGFDYTLRMDK